MNNINNKDNKISINIHSNFQSANSQYFKHKNTKTLSNSKSKEIDNDKNYLNKNKEFLHPLIHFTNLSSKKLKILGSISKSKEDKTNNDT